MATFEQAIELWKKEQAGREERRLAEEAEALAESEQLVKEQFEKIELTPLLIKGNHAYFQFQNEEIELVIRKAKYSMCLFYRTLGPCRICGHQTFTQDYELTLENIGYVICEPEKAYHECWVAPQDIEPVSVEKNTAESLIEYLQDLMLETIKRHEANSQMNIE